jgi:hypothetical protein
MRLIKACIALAAFAAIFVIPSMASASLTLTAPTGTVYNGNIIATNVAHGEKTKTQTVMTTSLGNLECTTATITGKILVNDGTNIVGTIETAEFRKTAGSATDTAHCTAPGGLGTVTVTPNHTTNPIHEPTAGVKHASLPWCIKAKAGDEFEVWGESENENCSGLKKRPLTFTLHSSLLGPCSYERTLVTGTYTTDASPSFSDAIATINDQEFKKITGSGFCPASGKLDMAFTLTEDKADGTEGNTAWIEK